jgi:hypothetical protein
LEGGDWGGIGWKLGGGYNLVRSDDLFFLKMCKIGIEKAQLLYIYYKFGI